MSKGRRPKAQRPACEMPMPACPEWLSAIAREEWARVCELVDLRAVDLAVLAAYCQQFAQWREAVKVLEQDGVLINTGKAANPKVKAQLKAMGITAVSGKHPAVGVVECCLRQLRALAAELGFSPAARGRLKEAIEKSTPRMGELESFLGDAQ